MIHAPAMSLRLLLRLLQVAGHLLLGFVLAFVCGLFFFRHVVWHRPVIAWWLRRLASILNLEVEVQGTPVAAPALWVSNHVSWMDIPVLGGVRPINFLSKAEVARWPLVGRLAQAAGTLFIQRGSGDSEQVRAAMADALRGGRNVLFFPEGTTTDGHNVRRFFPKLFQAAIDAGCPVQPMVICYRDGDGLHPVAPFIGEDALAPHLLHILNGERIRVSVRFLAPEPAAGADARTLALHCEEQMRHALLDLHGGSEPPNRLSLEGLHRQAG